MKYGVVWLVVVALIFVAAAVKGGSEPAVLSADIPRPDGCDYEIAEESLGGPTFTPFHEPPRLLDQSWFNDNTVALAPDQHPRHGVMTDRSTLRVAGFRGEVAHLSFDGSRVDAATAGGNPLLKEFREDRAVEGVQILLRGKKECSEGAFGV